MKNYTLILMMLALISCSSKKNVATQGSLCKSYYDKNLKMEVYTFVDDMPVGSADVTNFLKVLTKNLRVKNEADLYKTTTISFVVMINGEIKNVRIYNKEKKDYTEFDQEIIRVVNLIPNWSVGKCNGKTVPVLIVIPTRV